MAIGRFLLFSALLVSTSIAFLATANANDATVAISRSDPSISGLVDDFSPADQYNLDNTNDAGGYTDDDGTMSIGNVNDRVHTDGILSLMWNNEDNQDNEIDYWYTVIADDGIGIFVNSHLVLRLRGPNGSERVRVGLRTGDNQLSTFSIPENLIGVDWTTVNLALLDFAPTPDLTSTKSIVLDFPDDPAGTLEIDQIRLSTYRRPSTIVLVASEPFDVIAGEPVSVVIALFDEHDNPVFDFDGSVHLSLTNGAVQPPEIGGFVNGVAGATITLQGAGNQTFTIREVAGATTSFDVSIIQPNNAPTVNEGPADIALSSNTVHENADTSAALTVGTLTIADDALGTNSLAVTGGADVGQFQIAGNALQFQAGTVLDFETKSSYQVTVTASDISNPQLSVAKTFAITLADLLDFTITVDGQTSSGLVFGHAGEAVDGFDFGLDMDGSVAAGGGTQVHLVAPGGVRQVRHDFRAVAADTVITRWRLEVILGSADDGLNLAWNVSAAGSARAMYLQRLVEERPAGAPIDMKAVSSTVVSESGIFEVAYGAVETPFQLTVGQGWNLVSVPVMTAQSAGAIFAGAGIAPSIWSWDGERFQAANPNLPLNPEQGYWVYRDGAGEVDSAPISGIVADGRMEYGRQGWQLFAPVAAMPLPSELITRGPIVGFNPTSKRYQTVLPSAPLSRLSAYWIYVNRE